MVQMLCHEVPNGFDSSQIQLARFGGYRCRSSNQSPNQIHWLLHLELGPILSHHQRLLLRSSYHIHTGLLTQFAKSNQRRCGQRRSSLQQD